MCLPWRVPPLAIYDSFHSWIVPALAKSVSFHLGIVPTLPKYDSFHSWIVPELAKYFQFSIVTNVPKRLKLPLFDGASAAIEVVIEFVIVLVIVFVIAFVIVQWDRIHLRSLPPHSCSAFLLCARMRSALPKPPRCRRRRLRRLPGSSRAVCS